MCIGGRQRLQDGRQAAVADSPVLLGTIWAVGAQAGFDPAEDSLLEGHHPGPNSPARETDMRTILTPQKVRSILT